MSDFQRRDFLSAAVAMAAGGAASLVGDKEAKGGDSSFMKNVPDPVLAEEELPVFKFALEQSQGRVIGGSYGKEATVKQLPVSKGLAGVSMKLEPGAMRELNWHATAAEWAFVLEGRVRTTVIDPQGLSETNDFEPGDVGYIPQGYGHSIENVGEKSCRVLIGFNTGMYQTIDLSQWIAGNPLDVLATNFSQPASLFEKFPRRDVFIVDKKGR